MTNVTTHRAVDGGRTVRSLLLAGLIAAILVVPACDTLVDEGDTLVLQPKEVTFRFEFSGEDVTTGQPAAITSVSAADLGGALESDGYGKDEVVEARVTQAVLRRVNPIAFQLSSLSDFTLQLVAGGSQATVGSLEDLPAANSATLDLGPTRAVANFVRQPSFSAVARFVPEDLPDGDYVLTVTLEVQIEVEAL